MLQLPPYLRLVEDTPSQTPSHIYIGVQGQVFRVLQRQGCIPGTLVISGSQGRADVTGSRVNDILEIPELSSEQIVRLTSADTLYRDFIRFRAYIVLSRQLEIPYLPFAAAADLIPGFILDIVGDIDGICPDSLIFCDTESARTVVEDMYAKYPEIWARMVRTSRYGLSVCRVDMLIDAQVTKVGDRTPLSDRRARDDGPMGRRRRAYR